MGEIHAHHGGSVGPTHEINGTAALCVESGEIVRR